MIDLQTISIVLACASVSIAALYYAFTLRYTRMNMKNTLETRQAQLFMQIYGRLDDVDMNQSLMKILNEWNWDDFNDFWEKYGWEKNPETFIPFSTAFNYLEGIGVLVKENLIDIRLVALLMTGMTRILWEKFDPIIEDWREYTGLPRFISETEYLYNELMNYIEEHPELKT